MYQPVDNAAKSRCPYRKNGTRSHSGYSLIETIVVIMILSILATITVRSMRNSTDAARLARTRGKLDQVAFAITGNPELISGGSRIDYGYVGDIGALPSDLNALMTNPGLPTWNGPYLESKFSLAGSSESPLNDAWGQQFTYSGSTTVSSNGGGFSISRTLASSSSLLLDNSVRLTILDADLSPPGVTYSDSVLVELVVPNGTGGMQNRQTNPSRDGTARLSSIPIGRHQLLVIYLPTSDSLQRQLAVEPGSTGNIEIQFPTDLW